MILSDLNNTLFIVDTLFIVVMLTVNISCLFDVSFFNEALLVAPKI